MNYQQQAVADDQSLASGEDYQLLLNRLARLQHVMSDAISQRDEQLRAAGERLKSLASELCTCRQALQQSRIENNGLRCHEAQSNVQYNIRSVK